LCSRADTLGNAYLTSFFVSGAWDRNKLHQSLKAYQNAVSESAYRTELSLNARIFSCIKVTVYGKQVWLFKSKRNHLVSEINWFLN
jgi:hypothetical protein